jgi:hypothetical protein
MRLLERSIRARASAKSPNDKKALPRMKTAAIGPHVTIVSKFKGPIKKVATASGVLMITFRVADVTTKEALVCKAFGPVAERFLRKATIKSGAIIESCGQFNLFDGNLEFTVKNGFVRLDDSTEIASDPAASQSDPGLEDLQPTEYALGRPGEVSGSGWHEPFDVDPDCLPEDLYPWCPNCSPSMVTDLEGDGATLPRA